MKLSIVLALFTAFVLSCCSIEKTPEKETKPSVCTSVCTRVDGGLGWEIGTAVIEGHKYIYLMSSQGAAICPAKSDN